MPTDKKDASSYMDGVPVKISEKYKRRPVIRLPNSCQNCSPGPALREEYSFGLERNVLSRLGEWKKIRQQEVDKLEEKAKKWQDQEDEIDKFNKLTIESTKTKCTEVSSKASILQPINGVHSTILQPTNAPERPQNTTPQVKPNNFKMSDFETDNSSPFDNMELKTINDMEVLASVLSSSQPSAIPQVIDETYVPKTNGSVWNSWNAYPDYSSQQQYYAPSQYGSPPVYSSMMYPSSHPPQAWPAASYVPPTYSNLASGAHTAVYSTGLPYHTTLVNPAGVKSIHSEGVTNFSQPLKSNSKSVPDLALELEKEVKEYKMNYESKRKTKTPPPRTSTASVGLENWQPWPDLESPHHSADDVALNVSPLARNISEMGFPIERVLRALEKFSDDDKKVIEFLLQVQRLEEKKFKGELVERALHSNKYDEKAAEKHLGAAGVLLDLGFDLDRVENALLQSNNDRDAALELLIS